MINLVSFEKVFNRHLGGGHTHLFTEKSLLKFMRIKINGRDIPTSNNTHIHLN